MLFTELPLTDSLLEGLDAMNFKETTPVQEQAIPVILNGKDVIACAQTGTGKTAAFLLPLLNNLQTDNHEESKVNAIIMAPTRELAQQIDQMMEGFSYYTPFSSVAVYGGNDGEAWDIQKRGLQTGADVVIATPGRLLSHINLYNIDFSGIKYFILDEADRMLDMGFYDDIMKIVKLLPKDRQTVMFSATMPPKIQQMAKTILTDPKEISIAVAKPPESIIQSAYICYEEQKIEILKLLFKNKKPNKVILFSGKKLKVKEITKILRKLNLSVGEMHSDLDQSQREHIMHEFKNERVDILVATDIVSRGIDIDDITLVVNFDVPYDVEDYVHRIGRTARAGDSGMAITFVAPEEQYLFEQIEQFLKKNIYRIPVPVELGDTPEYNPKKNRRERGAKRHSSNKREFTKKQEFDKTGGSNKKDRPKRTRKTVKKRLDTEKKEQSTEKRVQDIERKTSKSNNEKRPINKRTSSNNEEKGGSDRSARSKSNRVKSDRSDRSDKSNKNYRKNKQSLANSEQQQSTAHSSTKPKGNINPKEKIERNKTSNYDVTKENKPIESKNKKLVKKKRTYTTDNIDSKKNINFTKTDSRETENVKKVEKKDSKKKWSWWPFGKK